MRNSSAWFLVLVPFVSVVSMLAVACSDDGGAPTSNPSSTEQPAKGERLLVTLDDGSTLHCIHVVGEQGSAGVWCFPVGMEQVTRP